MISNLKRLVKTVFDTYSLGGEAVWQETLGQLSIQGRWSNAAIFEMWRAVQEDGLPEWLHISICDATGADLDLLSEPFNERREQRFEVLVNKTTPEGVFVFLTLEGLKNGLKDQAMEKEARLVHILTDFVPFSSKLCRFEPLVDTDLGKIVARLPPASNDDEVPAGKLTRQMTRGAYLPRLAFWVEPEPDHATSATWEIWSKEAANQLVLVPTSEVWEDDTGLCVALAGVKGGPRKRNLSAGLDRLNAASFAALNEAASWIIEVPREAAVRHTYLVSELAREWPSSDPAWATVIGDRLRPALDGAKAHYAAHLLETSSDMIKSLTELRKALNDETAKAMDRTQSLVTVLARDLAAVLITLLLRLPSALSSSIVTNSTNITRVILFLLALWMAVSWIFTMLINGRFVRIIKESRTLWYSKAKGLLPTKDVEEMADVPLSRAEGAYQTAEFFVGLIYIMTFVGLIFLALYGPGI